EGAPQRRPEEDRPMETRANFALIGAFVILAAISALGFTLWLGQSQLQREFADYDIVFEGPVTLEEGAAVRYIGIKVGEVEAVRIDRSDPSKVRARVSIDAETPVKTDSTAVIDFAGITGVTFVQISAGSPTAPMLERRPGGPVPRIEAERTPLSQIFDSSAEVMQSFGTTMTRIDAALSDENLDSLARTLQNLETISDKLAQDDGLVDQLSRTLASANAAVDAFDTASTSIGGVGDDAAEFIGTLNTRLLPILNDLAKAIDSTDVLMSEGAEVASALRETVDGPASNSLRDFSHVSRDLSRLIQRLERLARTFEETPETFVVGDPAPYED
ncbi:MAG: MlaD family protein, partial [Pseudomonadota bacterium]